MNLPRKRWELKSKCIYFQNYIVKVTRGFVSMCYAWHFPPIFNYFLYLFQWEYLVTLGMWFTETLEGVFSITHQSLSPTFIMELPSTYKEMYEIV